MTLIWHKIASLFYDAWSTLLIPEEQLFLAFLKIIIIADSVPSGAAVDYDWGQTAGMSRQSAANPLADSTN